MAAVASPTRSAINLGASARRRAADALPAILADLERWVQVDSPSGDRDGLARVAADAAARLEAYGVVARVEPSDAGPYLHAVVDGGVPGRVALLCHHDTVFERGTAARRPFTVEGEHARGPGVADMKGGLAVAVHALRLLAALPGRVGRVELLSVPDEEERSEPFEGLDALRGCDAVLCLECGRPGNGVVTARKGGHWLTVELTGRAAHAGVDAGSGRSALLAACVEALRIARLDGAREGLGVHVTTLRAGEGANSVASRAMLDVDVRAWHDADLEWAVAEAGRFERHDGVDCVLEPSPRVPPLERDGAVASLAALTAAVADGLGTPIVEVSTGGVSDACWTAAAGIPSLDGLGPIGWDDHTPDEAILIPSLADRCALVVGLVAALGARVAGAARPPKGAPA